MSNSSAPPTFWRPGVVSAIAAFVLIRGAMLLWFTPVMTDVDIYLRYALAAADYDQMPYRDIPGPAASANEAVEYPPLGFWAIAVPRLLAKEPIPFEELKARGLEPYMDDYLQAFIREMMALDFISFALFLAIVWRRKPEYLALAGWCYVVVTTILAHVLHTRLDLGVSVCVLGWAYCWLRSDAESRTARVWSALSYAILGVGVSFKIIPGLIFPLAFFSDLATARVKGGVVRLVVGCLLFGLLALGPFAYYYAQAGEQVFQMFFYHGDRPCEIESIYATAMMAASPLGLQISPMHAYRSWNLVTTDSGLSNVLIKVSSGMLLLVLATGLLRARLRRAFSRTDAYCWGCWTVVAAMTVAKVLSIQYLVWGLPLFLLVGAEVLPRACYWRLMVTLVGIALLSTAIFPYLFSNVLPIPSDPPIPNRYPLLQLSWLPCSLLVLRNAALVGVTIWLTIKLWRKPPAGGPPGYTITRSVALWKNR